MAEYLLEGFAHVVESSFPIGCLAKAVFRTPTIADEKPWTRQTLLWQTISLAPAKCQLTVAIHHLGDGLLVDVA
jgi:hypothetical protein